MPNLKPANGKEPTYHPTPYLLKRDIWVLMVLLAAPAFAERRVTTTKGNALRPTQCKVGKNCQTKVPKDLTIPKAWEKLIDPTQKEFWREGNHLPDAGFVEWATNPTIENAKLYLIRMNAKRDRLHLMVKQQEQANRELIKAGVIANDYDFLAEHFGGKKASKTPLLKAKLDPKMGHVWFYFHPTCPHCHRQAEILAGNTNVIPMQVGGEALHNFKGLTPSQWAEKEDIKRYLPEGKVPVLIIYNAKTNKLSSLKGVQSIATIKRAAAALQAEDAAKKEGGHRGKE